MFDSEWVFTAAALLALMGCAAGVWRLAVAESALGVEPDVWLLEAVRLHQPRAAPRRAGASAAGPRPPPRLSSRA